MDTDSILIDGRKMADFLNFLFEYAQQVNYHTYVSDEVEGEYTLLSDWKSFFEKSTPFLLARIDAYDVQSLEANYTSWKEKFDCQPTSENLYTLIDYTFESVILPIFSWYQCLISDERRLREFSGISPEESQGSSRFKQRLADLVTSELSGTLKEFIQASNYAQRWFCTEKPSFFPFTQQAIWDLKLYNTLECPIMGAYASVLELEQTISSLFGQFLGVIKQIQSFAANCIPESLVPQEEAYQKYHEPHLGLLFAFLELFKYIQNDLNSLTTKHLDFFYKQILRLQPKAFEPDQVHLVFEAAKQLDHYLLPKDTLFKDGKDAKRSDVLYKLSEEVLIDKAQVQSLRTLFLSQHVSSIPESNAEKCPNIDTIAVDGVYMAPVANSYDGRGRSFPDGIIKNWASLGARESKIPAPGKTLPALHPTARLGFLLASPVLFLQEGKREVVIRFTCTLKHDCTTLPFSLLLEQLPFILKQPYFILTEKVLQQLPELFTQDSLSKVICEVWEYCKRKGESYRDWISKIEGNISLQEKLLLDCYLGPVLDTLCKEIQQNGWTNPDDLYQSTTWQLVVAQLENPLSDAGRAFLSGLLSAQNPYPLGYDLLDCLDIKRDASCEDLFSCCEMALLESILDRNEKHICCLTREDYFCLDTDVQKRIKRYYELIFYRSDIGECFPIFLDVDSLQEFLEGLGETDYLPLNESELSTLFTWLNCNNIFKVELSGEEGWYQPKRIKTEFSQPSLVRIDPPCDTSTGSRTQSWGIDFKLTIVLDEEEPPIVCFDTEVFEEDYSLEQPLPLVKVELNSELKINAPNRRREGREDSNKQAPGIYERCKRARNSQVDFPKDEACCLNICDTEVVKKVDLYEFFRYLQVVDTKIDVKVCGIKENILIQNEEGLLDPNSPFQPFGVRPVVIDANQAPDGEETEEEEASDSSDSEDEMVQPDGCPSPLPVPEVNLVGPNFYLGSHEIFRKCWKDICIHLNWKDKPVDLGTYYLAYDFEIKETDFELNLGILEGGQWKMEVGESRPNSSLCRGCEPIEFKEEECNPYLKRQNPSTLHYNRYLFVAKEEDEYFCKESDEDSSEESQETKHTGVGNGCACTCPKDLPPYPDPFPFEQTLKLESRFFPIKKVEEKDVCESIEALQAGTRDGFIKMTLENRDFLHNVYAITLAKKMLDLTIDNPTKSIGINGMLPYLANGTYSLDKIVTDINGNYIEPRIQSNETAIKDRLVQFLNDLPVDRSNQIKKGDIRIGLDATKVFIENTLIDTINIINVIDIILQPRLPNILVDVAGLSPCLPDGRHLLKDITSALFQFLISTLEDAIEEIHTYLEEFFVSLPVTVPDPSNEDNDLIRKADVEAKLTIAEGKIESAFVKIYGIIEDINIKITVAQFENLLPKEPWTPTIKNLSIDYSACADKKDISLIHLYPFEGTFKHESLEFSPPLIPVFEEEGNLYIGLSDLRPGAGLNLLFQLAEATADSELDRAEVQWHHLANNQWQPLREGFEIISDDTKGLTVSGIIKFALPSGMSRTGNTIMPNDLYWIRASVEQVEIATNSNTGEILSRPGKVKAICEALSVHTQAAKVSFQATADNDLQRLEKALPADQISKLVEPQAGIKKILQPYPSFGGKVPENGSNFYLRVSEHLRHKGRGIASFDYETLVLEAFPEIFKVKCINHDFGLSSHSYRMDAELAPGFILLAVIPDLTKLQPGQGMEPKAPVSLLESIEENLKQKISPFIRLKVLNPRFEKVDVHVTVKLKKGKNEAYYAAKLQEDLRHFLAPWYITQDSDKLVFGQQVNYSEVVKFIERLDYVDFIACLNLFSDPQLEDCSFNSPTERSQRPTNLSPKVQIDPLTARSILTAGEICVDLVTEYCDNYCTES